jgi:hypothetical protein
LAGYNKYNPDIKEPSMKSSLVKAVSTLALVSTLMGVAGNAMAIDMVLIVPQAIVAMTGRMNFAPFSYTASAVNEATAGYRSGLNNIIGVMMLPFAILDEKTNEISVNASDLKDLAYSDSEIAQYQNDLNKLSTLSVEQKVSTKADLENVLSSLDLGIVAKEQLRIK